MSTFLVLLSRFSCYADYMISLIFWGAKVDGHWDTKYLFAKYCCITHRFRVYEQKAWFGICNILFQTHTNASPWNVLKYLLDCLGWVFSSFCFSSICFTAKLYWRPRKSKFPLNPFWERSIVSSIDFWFPSFHFLRTTCLFYYFF